MSNINIDIVTDTDNNFNLEVEEGDKYADHPAYHEDNSPTNCTINLRGPKTDVNGSLKWVCFDMYEFKILNDFLIYTINTYGSTKHFRDKTTRITYKLSPPVPIYDYCVSYEYDIALKMYYITDGDRMVGFDYISGTAIRRGIKTILDTFSWVTRNNQAPACEQPSDTTYLDCENL
jgi:hypothetical protein